MNNERSGSSNKYLVWMGLALTCLVFDAVFFLGLGAAVKWLAGLASPLVWGGLALIALSGARFARYFEGVRVRMLPGPGIRT